MWNHDPAKAVKKRQKRSQDDNLTTTPKKQKQYSSLSPPRFQPKLASDVFNTSIISTLDNLQAVHKNMELFEEELRIELEQKFAHKIDYYKHRLEKAEKKVRTLQTELDQINRKSKDQAFLKTLQNGNEKVENLDYFHVTRPLGDTLIGKKFDYDMADTKRLGFFEFVPKAIDFSSLPYPMVDRFITLLPSDNLRRVSYTSKYFYKKCLSLRGLEVQLFHADYPFVRRRDCACFENGRLIIDTVPEQLPAKLMKFFPYLKTQAYAHNVDHARYKSFFDNFVKNYTYFYSDSIFFESFNELVHDKVETFEIYCDALDEERCARTVIPKLQHFKVKNLSFDFVYDATSEELDEAKQLLVQHKHKSVQNLYFCYKRESSEKFGKRIWIYDQLRGEWIRQHKRKNLSHYSGIMNIAS